MIKYSQEIFNEIRKELNKKCFVLTYSDKREKYCINKEEHILQKLWLSKECIINKGVYGIILEYKNMLDFVKERECFLDTLKNKTIEQLSYDEFNVILDNDIPHEGVSLIYYNYWAKLSNDEKRHIRSLTDGINSPYKSVSEYICKQIAS